MPKIFQKKWRAKYQKYSKWWQFGGLAVVALMAIGVFGPTTKVSAAELNADCPDVKIVFVRGSGGTRWEDPNYLTFKSAMTDKLALTHISYGFEDLDYPAVSVGNIHTLLTTFVSGGEAYEFGASVSAGVKELKRLTNNSACPGTRYVLGGYSQGAMVISKALPHLDPEKIIYAATFGDPKLYLPEGVGAVPAACKGENLSNYRIYVPDCRAYSGMLGGYNPYQTVAYIDKLGTWCNKADFFCSSYLNIGDHLAYTTDGIYEEASKTIFSKIVDALGIENNYVSPHDTAILIDTTGSMARLIDQYKAEALKLAKETFENGGRVALFSYRDLWDDYDLHEWCDFNTCTEKNFADRLNALKTDGGGDEPESLLSAAFKTMKRLDWRYGATKSVVVLTDAGYHSPDLDGITFDQVVQLSKSIDPVNFYIITPEQKMPLYQTLATATGGAVASTASDLSLTTRQIMTRYDSLPRVEEAFLNASSNEPLPEISDVSWEFVDADKVRISWVSSGTRTLVVLNDAILGVTEENEIVLEDLDFSIENVVSLTALTETRRGGSVSVNLGLGAMRGDLEISEDVVIPKAPNTGKSK